MSERKAKALYRAVIKFGSKSLGLAVMAKKLYEDLSDEQKAEVSKIALLAGQAFEVIEKENGQKETAKEETAKEETAKEEKADKDEAETIGG